MDVSAIVLVVLFVLGLPLSFWLATQSKERPKYDWDGSQW
jgi:hypothetical protein